MARNPLLLLAQIAAGALIACAAVAADVTALDRLVAGNNVPELIWQLSAAGRDDSDLRAWLRREAERCDRLFRGDEMNPATARARGETQRAMVPNGDRVASGGDDLDRIAAGHSRVRGQKP